MIFHYRISGNFQIFAGGELGVNILGKFPRDNENLYYYKDDDIFDFRERINFVDASVALGVGYILWDVIDINFKYNLGVTNVSKIPDTEFKKSWLTLSVGYSFRE